MPETTIEWTDRTWNPYTWNCTQVSPGCTNCYAMTLADRFGRNFAGNGFTKHAPVWRDSAMKELRRLKSPTVLFVNSMSDTYHERVPVRYVHSIHNIAAMFPQHTFLLLTKRPERAYYLAPYLQWPDNLWLGTSVENEDYLWRLEYLLQIPAAGHFLSAEPLLGPLPRLKWYLPYDGRAPGLGRTIGVERPAGFLPHTLDWVIVGGESGVTRRPFDKAWATDIRDQCVQAGVPFMFKQGSARLSGKDRLLDGREWNGSPFDLKRHTQDTEHTITIHTAQMAISDDDALDITVKSASTDQGLALAPTWEMVRASKSGAITWEQYTAKYLTLLRQRYASDPTPFLDILRRQRVVLKCYCPAGANCHRHLAIDVLSKIATHHQINVTIAGEAICEADKPAQLALFDLTAPPSTNHYQNE
jgi:protein gp37/uncharacterized protein YeaO (DUF488 family)